MFDRMLDGNKEANSLRIVIALYGLALTAHTPLIQITTRVKSFE